MAQVDAPLECHFLPNWRQQNLPKKLKIAGENTGIREIFNEVSGKPHKVENPKTPSMLAKRFVSSKH